MELEQRRTQALELLARLTEAHGAPGCENAVRRIFRSELGDHLNTDKTGSIFCEQPGRAEHPRIMLTAHMDEVGFVVQAITRSGLIKLAPLGGWWAHTVLGQRMRILTRAGDEVLGVVGAKPPHFLEEGERDKVLKWDKMFVDIGATGADDVRLRFGVRLGDTIVPDTPFVPMGDPDCLLGKAFDNRVGLALVIQTLQLLRAAPHSHPNTVVGAGTVQEEIGTRGAQTAVFSLAPDIAVVLEGTPADDLPEVPEDERQGALGQGVQVRLLDPSAIMNRQFADYIVETAEQCGISHQVAVRKSGATDARVIHLHGAGVPTVVLGVPARYIHTHNSIIHLSDYLGALELVLTLIRRLDQATCERFTAFAD